MRDLKIEHSSYAGGVRGEETYPPFERVELSVKFETSEQAISFLSHIVALVQKFQARIEDGDEA